MSRRPPAMVAASRADAIAAAHRIAVAAFGWPDPDKPSRPQVGTAKKPTQTRRRTAEDAVVDAVDGAVEKGVDWLVGKIAGIAPDTAIPGVDPKVIVPALAWKAKTGVTSATITYPANVDVSAGSTARKLFETLFEQRFGKTHDFTFDWPRGQTCVTASMTVEREDIPDTVDWWPSDRWDVFPLGQSAHGRVGWSPLEHPHMLVAGPSGMGKSALLRGMQVHALRHDWQLVLVDPGGVDFQWAEGLPNVAGPSMTTLDTYELLNKVECEIETRKRLLREAGFVKWVKWRQSGKPGCPPPMIVFVDEAAAVFATKGATPAEKEIRDLARGAGGVIASQGRKYGIWIVVATQFPYAYVLEGWRGNLDAAVGLAGMTPTEARVAGNSDDAAKLPTTNRSGGPLWGRASVRLGRRREVQLAYLDEDDVRCWLPQSVDPEDLGGDVVDAEVVEVDGARRRNSRRDRPMYGELLALPARTGPPAETTFGKKSKFRRAWGDR